MATDVPLMGMLCGGTALTCLELAMTVQYYLISLAEKQFFFLPSCAFTRLLLCASFNSMHLIN